MRVSVYAEEMTDRIEIVEKEIDGQKFTGLRIYLELPTTVFASDGIHKAQVKGPFIHRDGDDDSSAVTFWGKKALREVLVKAITELDKYHFKKTSTIGKG